MSEDKKGRIEVRDISEDNWDDSKVHYVGAQTDIEGILTRVEEFLGQNEYEQTTYDEWGSSYKKTGDDRYRSSILIDKGSTRVNGVTLTKITIEVPFHEYGRIQEKMMQLLPDIDFETDFKNETEKEKRVQFEKSATIRYVFAVK